MSAVNENRARYALALASMDRPEALEMARKAWRNGTMSGPAELYLVGLFGSRFSLARGAHGVTPVNSFFSYHQRRSLMIP